MVFLRLVTPTAILALGRRRERSALSRSPNHCSLDVEKPFIFERRVVLRSEPSVDQRRRASPGGSDVGKTSIRRVFTAPGPKQLVGALHGA